MPQADGSRTPIRPGSCLAPRRRRAAGLNPSGRPFPHESGTVVAVGGRVGDGSEQPRTEVRAVAICEDQGAEAAFLRDSAGKSAARARRKRRRSSSRRLAKRTAFDSRSERARSIRPAAFRAAAVSVGSRPSGQSPLVRGRFRAGFGCPRWRQCSPDPPPSGSARFLAGGEVVKGDVVSAEDALVHHRQDRDLVAGQA